MQEEVRDSKKKKTISDRVAREGSFINSISSRQNKRSCHRWRCICRQNRSMHRQLEQHPSAYSHKRRRWQCSYNQSRMSTNQQQQLGQHPSTYSHKRRR